MKTLPARLAGHRWLALLLVAIAARAVTFGNPIVNVDEEFYYTVGRATAHGALPYVDIWDRKPFGLFLLYLLPGAFAPPVGIWLYQAMALAAVVATAALIVTLAERAGWRRGALVAALLYILWLDLADGQGGQAPVFYNLLMAGAVRLIVAATEAAPGRSRRPGIAALVLVGIALQIKYSVVFEGVAFGLWLLRIDWRARRSPVGLLSYGAALCLTALLPTTLVAVGYAAIGHGQDFLYANFLSIAVRRSDPIAESLGNLAVGIALLAPLLLLAAIGSPRASRTSSAPPVVSSLRLWLSAALFGFLIFGSWFNHYTLPVMLPAAICAAGAIGGRRYGPIAGGILLVVAAVAGQYILQAERRTRGTPAQFDRLVAAIGTGPGALYVYQGSAMLYPATGRPALTRYVFPTHLMLAREQGAVGTDQAREIDRIFDQGPEIVVLQSPEDGEDLAKRAIAEHRIADGFYRRYARLPLGNKTFDLFRRP